MQEKNMDLEKKESSYSLPGFKVLLIGDSGSGKTFSITSLLKMGITPFIIFTEPGMSILRKGCEYHKVDMDKLHWTHIAQSSQSWDALKNMATMINNMNFDSLTKITDPKKRENLQWIELIGACNHFVCDRTGEDFGCVSDWGNDRALIIDSLSGMNEMSMNLTVGGKPTIAPGEWQVAQRNLFGFVKKLISDVKCHVVITGHLAREKDEVKGGLEVMPSTLGKALAPQLPKEFDEVILAERTGTDFNWSTAKYPCLKARNLPIRDKLPPTFDPLVKEWVKSGGVIPSKEKETEVA